MDDACMDGACCMLQLIHGAWMVPCHPRCMAHFEALTIESHAKCSAFLERAELEGSLRPEAVLSGNKLIKGDWQTVRGG